MKNCGVCGAQLDDNAAFCTGCGAKFEVKEAPKAANSASPFAPKTKANGSLNKPMLIGIVAVAAVVVVLLVVLISSMIGGYKKPIKKYFADLKKQSNSTSGYYLKEMADFSAVKKLDYEIKKKEKISKSDLKDLAEIYEDRYDAEYKFSAGYAVEVDYEVEFKNEDADDYDTTTYFIVVKKGTKWYIYEELSTYEDRDIDLDEAVETYIKYNEKK